MNISVSKLNIGETFEVGKGLSKFMKNLVLLRASDSAALVLGDFRDDENSSWNRRKERIAPSVLVTPTGVIKEKISIIDGVISMEGLPSSGKRGRKSVLKEFKWPDGEFSFKGLSEKMGIPYHTVANAFNKDRNKFIKVKEIPNGGRGKAVSIWKLKE